MAHLVETLAYAGEVPWHGLGVEVSNELSPAQMMQKAGLDWEVVKEPLYYGDGIEVPTKAALIRKSDEKLLDVIGNDWNPVQNEEAFEFFAEYVLAGDMEMHTAGSLKGGKQVWALAKVKESFDILGGDQVDSYLLFSNPHQYGKSLDVRFTPIRVVCNNTLTFSLNSSAVNSVKMNHRSQFNPDHVKETLGIAHEKFAKYKEMAEFLSTKHFSVDALVQYYNEVFPNRTKEPEDVKTVDDLTRTARKAFEVLETQPGHEYGEGSWWQAANSVSYLTDHVLGRSNDGRMASAWFGPNKGKKLKAFNKAIELASAS